MRKAAMCIFERKLPGMDEREKYDPYEANTEYSEPEPGRFLKNPLPVPKRRPHVQMDFDLTDDWDIPRGQDHFDIEIAEDDDFDI